MNRRRHDNGSSLRGATAMDALAHVSRNADSFSSMNPRNSERSIQNAC
ncbi:hypothetical protein RRSWK_03864 [Rhodopirellula sp. SWK7]|nr:hypothetical protein RRSWK_03864 [Rhodopirellula sp. SWK7]